MNYKAYFALEKRLQKMGYHIHRSDLIFSFTEGRTDSLRVLGSNAKEYWQFIHWVKVTFNLEPEDWQQSPENRMRRKIFALFIHHMGYTKKRMENWCIKYGKYHKRLNNHTHNELVELVTQAEKTYASFIPSVGSPNK